MAWVLAHLQRRGRENDSSKVVFNSETKCTMGRSDCGKVRWSSFTVRSGKHQLQGGLWRRASRKLRFERSSLAPPRSRCARRHLRGLSSQSAASRPASRASPLSPPPHMRRPPRRTTRSGNRNSENGVLGNSGISALSGLPSYWVSTSSGKWVIYYICVTGVTSWTSRRHRATRYRAPA